MVLLCLFAFCGSFVSPIFKISPFVFHSSKKAIYDRLVAVSNKSERMLLVVLFYC